MTDSTLTLPRQVRRTVKTAVNRSRQGIPDSMVPSLVRARARRAAKNPARFARARAEMDYLVGASGHDIDLDALTPRYMEFEAFRSEARWHPNLINNQEIEGYEHLRQRDERGLVVAFLHHGSYEGAMASLARRGLADHLYCVVADEMLAPDAPLFLRQHLKVGHMFGGHYIPASNAVQGIADALGRGGVVMIAIDVPGPHVTEFAGRRRACNLGPAGISTKFGIPLTTMTAQPDAQGRPSIKIGQPWEPSDFASTRELVPVMLERLETATLAWPEGYHLPTLRWGVPADSPSA